MDAYVGLVRFDYLKTPKGTILDFLEFLADNNDEADWHLGAYHNVIVEYESENLLAQVDAFVKEKALSPDAKAKVLAWVQSTPLEGRRHNAALRHLTASLRRLC